jgi:hypothetical protein
MHLRIGCAFFGACLLGTVLATACSTSTIAACSDEPDVSGGWSLTLSPEPPDAGVPVTIADTVSVDATLVQGPSTDFLGLGHYVYGTLTTSDASYFTTLTIPKLVSNDGSKTGAVLGCKLNINVPIATPVTDDNVDQGPLRIALVGAIDAPGHLTGSDGSQLIMSDDASNTVRSFLWVGTKQ